MRIKKKGLALWLALFLGVSSLSGCGGGDDGMTQLSEKGADPRRAHTGAEGRRKRAGATGIPRSHRKEIRQRRISLYEPRLPRQST